MTVLGFDYGTQKIGVAIGQSITQTANPLPQLKARDGIPNWDDIAILIKEWQPDAFVVGIPLNMDGSESAISIRAAKFSRRLEGRFQLPAHTFDERLSTFDARLTLNNSEQKNSRASVDSLAAALIIETWFNSQ